MRKIPQIALVVFLLAVVGIGSAMTWGFYGHRLINRMAVFTVPQPLFGFYKANLKYIQEIATSPDKRRSASPVESVRHYIDLDRWDEYDLSLLRQPIADVILTFARIEVYIGAEAIEQYDGLVAPLEYSDWTVDHYVSLYDSVASRINDLIVDRSVTFLVDSADVRIVDQFTEHGIVPYHLNYYYRRLVSAMQEGNISRVIALSAEIGHYISDAHVPLHTTENYNGQLTGQDGIHAFWESRLPELFAETEYDFFVGQAEYISDVDSFFWDMTLTSHRLVDEVLNVEMSLRQEYPASQQYCYERRGNAQVRVPCREYSREYHVRMKDMVENRMIKSIKAVGSIWYSAWVDAGRPALDTAMAVELSTISKDTSQIEENHLLRAVQE